MKYYKDYTSNSKVTDKGKVIKEVEYTGEYYEYRLSNKDYKNMQLVIFGDLVVSSSLFVAAGLINNNGSYCFYVLLPYLCILLALIYLLSACFSIPRKMHRMEYILYDKSYLRVKFSLVGMIAASITTVIGDAIFIINNLKEIDMFKEIVFGFLNIFIAVISILLLIYHNRIVCEKLSA